MSCLLWNTRRLPRLQEELRQELVEVKQDLIQTMHARDCAQQDAHALGMNTDAATAQAEADELRARHASATDDLQEARAALVRHHTPCLLPAPCLNQCY